MRPVLYLIILGFLLRLPFFLLRGDVSDDELNYFIQILHLMDISHFQSLSQFINYDKPLFVLLNAPVVGLLYLLTHNSIWSVAIFPFLLSLVSIALVFHLASKLYDERVGFWAGLIWACLPSLVKSSPYLAPHAYYAYLFLFSFYLLLRSLETGKDRYLISSALIFAGLGRVRPEGIGVFISALLFLILSARKKKFPHLFVGKTALLFGASFIVMFILPKLVFIATFGPPKATYLQAVTGKILGKLALKLKYLFELSTPGGFVAANKIEYLVRNFYLVPYIAAVLLYDTLKTVFILPVRLVPPLLFLFLGALFFRSEDEKPETELIVKIMLASLLLLLAYPLIFFLSHSRYIFSCLPVLIIFIAVGFSTVEKKLALSGMRLKPRLLLESCFFCYLALFYFVIYVPMFQQRDKLKNTAVREWVNKEFSNGPRAVMSTLELPFHVNMNFYSPQAEISFRDGQWGYFERISLNKTLTSMRLLGITTLVISTAIRNKKTTAELDYFATTAFQIMGDGDEGLEMLRDHSYIGGIKHGEDFYLDYIKLINSNNYPDGLTFQEIIPYNNFTDTLFIFRYDSQGKLQDKKLEE